MEPLGGSQFVDMLSDTQTVSQGLYPPDSQDSQEPGTQELMALTGANLVPMPKKVQVSQIYKDFCITKIVCVCVCMCVCLTHCYSHTGCSDTD